MKNNAAEYFQSLSPVKGGGSSGMNSHESRSHNSRSGRCHCCPYGYHIDLDFVRFCDMLTQGSKNDSPTLRQLKKLKRARRRQTKSMEVLLGLSPGKENESPDHQSQDRLEIIEEPYRVDSLDRHTSSRSRRINAWKDKSREKTPPPLPLRQCNNLSKKLHREMTNTVQQSFTLNSDSNLNASEALQEAVMDFEEMLENTKEKGQHKSRSETLPSELSGYNSSYNSHHYPHSPKLGSGLGRSHSLPRQSFDEPLLTARRPRTNSVSSICSNSSATGLQNVPHSMIATNAGPYNTAGFVPVNNVGIIQQQAVPSRLSEALAALNAAQGYPMPQPDFDAMSVMSGMSGVSTSTLQSIREQMASSLNRLKELEEEVKSIPMLQIKLNVLKEEKRLLIQQFKNLQKGEDIGLLLPPSVDVELSDMSEDELEGRLNHLRHSGILTPRNRRRRSESPLRVNLEEFRSYRRARRGSISEGSEAESVVEDVPLFIKEANDHLQERRTFNDRSVERRASFERSERRSSQNHSMPNTPLVSHRHVRDASTNCRVLTRDIGITHIGARTRSVGITTDRMEVDMKKEIKAKPCMQCYERNKKTFNSKSVGTPISPQKEKERKLSVSNVAVESFDPNDADFDDIDKDENSKNTFLQKLGRKSAIISRLSEPQLAPPILTFDNSTNTEQVRQRDQRTFTSIAMDDIFTKTDLNDHLAKARKEWEARQSNLFTKADLNNHISKAKKEWDLERKELFSRTDLNEHLAKAKKEWDLERKELFTRADLNEQIAKIKKEWELDKKELFSRIDLDEQIAKAKREWDLERKELFTRTDLNEQIAKAKKECEFKQSELISKTHNNELLNESLSKAKEEWKIERSLLFSKADLDDHLSKARREWESKQNELFTRADLEEHVARAKRAWEARQNERYSKTELDDYLSKAKQEWETARKSEMLLNSMSPTKPMTSNIGIQVLMDDPSLIKTSFQPLLQSVGVMAQPKSVSVGVGKDKITDVLCEKCMSVRTRSVASGNSSVSDIFCDKCSSVKCKSVAVGDFKLSELWCEKCSTLQTRTVGSSNDRINDRICDKCDNIRTRSVASGSSLPAEKLVKESPIKHQVNVYVQTSKTETRTKSINTVPINIKKDEIGDTSATPSPALTPEIERRSYGSSGVRICDKCHETIQSVAKDIVNTTGIVSGSNLPPIPPQISKIPRLVDLGKVEPRLDIPLLENRGPRLDSATLDTRSSKLDSTSLDTRCGRNISSSLESSLTESQLSSMNNSFSDTKTSSVSLTAVRRSDSFERKQIKDSLAKKQVQTRSSYSESSKATSESDRVESKESSTPAVSRTSYGTEKISPFKSNQPTGVTLTSAGSSKASSELPSMSNSPQVKRVPYNRQNTYTKFSEGVVNLGFDEAASSQKQKQTIKEEPPQTDDQSTGGIPRDSKEKKDESKETIVKNSSAPAIQGKTAVSSCLSSSESEDETSLLEASFSSQPDVPSSFQSASSLFTNTSERSRKKSVPSREMKAALKVLNDSIGKPVRSGQQLTNAANIIQREWFKVSSTKDANPHAVEDYMDVFEDYSKGLLQRVVNLSDVNGNTAMHYAVSHGNFDVVSILLDSKVCNINQQNKAGYTAIMLVSLAQIRSDTHASVVQRLFQLGDVNIKASQHGQTALMLAVSHGRVDMVRLLVAAGAEINIQDEDGSTALMCSAEHGHLAIVKFLLGHPDTDPTLMDNDGSTALTIAVEAGHKDVGVLLYKHMNLSRGSSPYSSMRVKRSRTPTASRPAITPPPRSSAPSSPGRSRKSSAPVSPGRSRQSSASLSNLMI